MSTSKSHKRGSRDSVVAGEGGSASDGTAPAASTRSFRQDVFQREKSQYGGMKFGSAFFGWLTATGTAVLLTAIVAATGAALGLGVDGGPSTDITAESARTVGFFGAIALLAILFIAYYAGGYVAGRMARFDGARQGFAVWLWAIIMAILAAVVTVLAGGDFNILARLNNFPRIPIDEGDLTTAGLLTAILVPVASLVGAVIGGVAGMRFHRKVDKAGLGR